MMLRALLAVVQLASQTALVGTVTDSSGSVVPGATVVAVNIGTQDRRHANGPLRRGARQLHLRRGVQDARAAHVRQHTAQHPARARTRHHGFVAREELPAVRRTQFQFRAEAFNLFNRPNFNNPNATFGTTNFGRITSAQSMRQMQLGAKILF
jgi:hypothetical protein